MIVLGIDTATPQVSVALHLAADGAGAAEGTPIGSFVAGALGRRHGEVLAPALEALCRLCATPISSVDAVAVDVGPGLFTGLRVGVATGQALASALGVPAVAVSSLEALAFPRRTEARLVAAVVDARRGEVFSAVYQPEAGMACRIGPLSLRPEVLVDELGRLGSDVLAVGDGALRYAELFRADHRVEVAGVAGAFPSAAVVADMAARRLVAAVPPAESAQAATAGPATPAGAPPVLRPIYIREPDVRIGWAEREPVGPAGVRTRANPPTPAGVPTLPAGRG